MESAARELLSAPVEAARLRLQNPRELSDRVAMGRAIWRDLVIGFAAQLGELNLGFTQLAALYALADSGTMTVADLADTLGRSPSAVSRLADGLVKRQLIERNQDAEDRRQRTLTLTGRGQASTGPGGPGQGAGVPRDREAAAGGRTSPGGDGRGRALHARHLTARPPDQAAAALGRRLTPARGREPQPFWAAPVRSCMAGMPRTSRATSSLSTDKAQVGLPVGSAHDAATLEIDPGVGQLAGQLAESAGRVLDLDDQAGAGYERIAHTVQDVRGVVVAAVREDLGLARLPTVVWWIWTMLTPRAHRALARWASSPGRFGS